MPVQFIGRLFLFVDNAYWMVIDHVLSRNEVTPLGLAVANALHHRR
jgi:hypothetical protein